MFQKEELKNLYFIENRSIRDIANISSCSEGKVNYWFKKYNIKKRNISDAIYLKHHPDGDPFSLRMPRNKKEERLFGLGIGIFLGEGNKVDKSTIRVGNTDVTILRIFVTFLLVFFNIHKDNLRFHLQIFSDVDTIEAQKYWIKELGITKNQFYKTSITKSIKKGTYKHKNKRGVLTVYYSNVKARKLLDDIISQCSSVGRATPW